MSEENILKEVPPHPSVNLPTAPDTSSDSTREAKLIRLALSLSISLMELRGRILREYYLMLDRAKRSGSGNSEADLPDKIADGFWRASTWRGLYSRIVGLHQALELDVEIDLARYSMGDGKPIYLSKELGITYTELGLSSPNLKFKPAEKLRQGLNFLTCLYQELDDREQVLDKIFAGNPPCLKLPEVTPLPDRAQHLIGDLTFQVDAMILAWDSYAREQFFARSNTMLMARYGYAVGRSLGELSWFLSYKTTRAMTASNLNEQELSQKIYEIWLDLFSPRNIAYLQRQLGTLTNDLEKDYYIKQKKVLDDQAQDEDKETSDLKSPRTAINAVIQSLDYWQMVLLEMSDKGRLERVETSKSSQEQKQPTWAKDLTLGSDWNYTHLADLQYALVEQSGSWFDLVAGRQDLLSFKITNLADNLIQDYRQEITHEVSSNLLETFEQMQKEVNELVKMASEAATNVAETARSALKKVFNQKWIWLGVGITVLLVLVGIILAVTVNLTGGGLSLAGLAQGANMMWSQRKVKESEAQIKSAEDTQKGEVDNQGNKVLGINSAGANVGAMVLSSAGQLRDSLENSLEKGFAQLKREMQVIGATLALSGPLVEFVTHNCDFKNDLEFLNNIVWSKKVKESQRNRIITAAFGTFGSFLAANADHAQPTPDQVTPALPPVEEPNKPTMPPIAMG
ncbi:MAG: hypothetical protein WCS37_11245 [Chloroflexota bacterium]